MKRLPILASLLILTACTVVESPTPTAAPIPTSTASVTPTATATASVTPSITASPIATKIQSTPDFLALPISNDPLFAPGPDLDCQLPCWQGLRIGESTDEDIQRVLDETFGFNGTVDFFNDDPPIPPPFILDAPGFYTTGYSWGLSEDGAGFSVIFVIDEATRKLHGFRFSSAPVNQFTVHTPQQIIRELGAPDYIYLNAGPGFKNVIFIDLNLIYKEGMNIFYSTEIYSQEESDAEEIEYNFENYCLNTPSTVIRDYIFEPFNGLTRENATPVQEIWLFDYLERLPQEPIDEVLGLTIEEFTEIALRDENPCIEISPDMLPDN